MSAIMHAADRLVTAVLLGWVYAASGSLTWVGVIALCRLVPGLAPTNRVHGVLTSSTAGVGVWQSMGFSAHGAWRRWYGQPAGVSV